MESAAENDTGPAEAVEAKRKAVERPRFPLVWKLFGLTALLIVLVVAVAVGITIERANQIASTTVNKSISGAARLFKTLETQRLNQLALPARLLGKESVFVAYLQRALTGDANSGTPGAAGSNPSVSSAAAPASGAAVPTAPTIDLVSIADQLEERRQSFGSDLFILLDDEGRIIYRTDQPMVTSATREDLYEQSQLVKRLVDDASLPSTSGVMALGNRLFHAAVAPIGAGANNVRQGYLVNALVIDDAFANRIAESTNAGVMFAPSSKVTPSPVVARSSNAPSIGMQQMTGVDTIFRSGRSIRPSNITIDRNAYVMTGEPLLSGNQTVGAAVFLRSLDTELAPFKQIEQALLLGGGGALLLAFIFSWLIARRLTRPIEQLAGMAQAVTAGDYDVQPDVSRNDEVGILGRSFAKMITALRDKADLEELYEQMAARSQQRESTPHMHEAPLLQEGTVLVTDLRGLPPTVGGGDAASVIKTVAAAMKLQEVEVGRQEGTVRHVIGHRLISVFTGDRGILHAIRAARAINEELGTHPEKMSIGVGIATGEFVTGSVDLSHDSGLAIIGNAPLLAMIFAWHAPTGYAYISQETAQAAGGEIVSGSSREEVVLKWLSQPLAVASMPLASLNTNVMRSLGATTGSAATMRIDGTAPGLTAPAMAAQDLTPGMLFANRYLVDSVVGRGGMGVVYKASDIRLDEMVAIKTLPGDVMTRSPEELERFKREIRLARKITHRNVLRTYDYGEADGVYFISMEFVRGYTLSELLEEAASHQMALRIALGITRQICRGLEAAHEQTIVHRDIKPQNVLIDHKGEVKLMDFGIARMAESTDGMTQAGLIVGTPHYMSPEQVQGRTLDARSDVYSMGVLIYEMLAGKKPFNSPSLTGILTAHVTETPKPLIEVRPEVGRQVNAIVMRCLAKEPKERYADAGKLLQDLDAVQAPPSVAAA